MHACKRASTHTSKHQHHNCTHTGLSGPLFLKAAVDTLSAGGPDVLLRAVRCVMVFGLCGVLQHLTKELTYPIWTPISQAVSRRVAYQTFSHVLDLDITFHVNRRTGRLSRILERGALQRSTAWHSAATLLQHAALMRNHGLATLLCHTPVPDLN